MIVKRTALCKQISTAAAKPEAPIALASDGGNTVPEWIQLLPSGPAIRGRDGRGWTMSDAARVVAQSLQGRPLHVDYEHASEVRASKGHLAPAAGWITDLEVRDTGVWARVEWTERAAQMIGAREYRYISPVFTYDRESLEIIEIISAGLTNIPNLSMSALNQARLSEEPHPMTLTAICRALDLQESANEAAILAAINTLIERAKTPPLEKFVPRADYDAAVKKAGEAEAALNQVRAEKRDAEIADPIEKAIEAGKITPATKDYYVSQCRAEGGIEAFKKFVETAPVISVKADSGLDKRDPAKDANGALSEEEKAVCRVMGLTEEQFLKAKAA